MGHNSNTMSIGNQLTYIEEKLAELFEDISKIEFKIHRIEQKINLRPDTDCDCGPS